MNDEKLGLPRVKFLGPIMFEAGQRRELRYEITEIDTPFHVMGFAVPHDMKLTGFMIHDIRRNGVSQAISNNPIPLLAFSDEAVGINIDIETLRYGDSISVGISNGSSDSAIFVGILYGVSESNVTIDDASKTDGSSYVASFGPRMIEAHSEATLEVELKMDLQPTLFMVPMAIGFDFDIRQLDVAGKPQLDGSVDASRIDECQQQRNANLQRASALTFSNAGKKGDKIKLVVYNKTAFQRSFSGVLFGKAVS